ncbi:hypothetical protein [Kutzneria sp. 744]|uniref:hypothetical protein n=1 Tax=Kutzneria sp. (strain 744) TaxID=345341 RepID=UPI0003EED6E7|nr:hypothetical protein [Kutzneria sp. 744]EWM19733.1 hypothetical protein KUTG_10037 [Kutzneria sp. 744]
MQDTSTQPRYRVWSADDYYQAAGISAGFLAMDLHFLAEDAAQGTAIDLTDAAERADWIAEQLSSHPVHAAQAAALAAAVRKAVNAPADYVDELVTLADDLCDQFDDDHEARDHAAGSDDPDEHDDDECHDIHLAADGEHRTCDGRLI